MSELIVIFITIGIGMDWIYFYFSFGLLWRQTIHFFLGVNLFGTEQPYIFCAARSWILWTCRFKYADLFTICFDQYAAYAHSWRVAVRNSAVTVQLLCQLWWNRTFSEIQPGVEKETHGLVGTSYWTHWITKYMLVGQKPWYPWYLKIAG